MSSWIHDTVADFGRQLGIDGLGLGSHGVTQLAFASGALLAVEPLERPQGNEVLVYLARPAGHQAAALLRVAWARATRIAGGGAPVQVALRGTGDEAMLIALQRLPERGFTPQALAQAVDHLSRWLDDVQAGRA
jgi:type III secretion system chaperone SycN